MAWLIGAAAAILAWVHFGPWATVWLGALTILAHRNPGLTPAVLLLGLPFDQSRPLFSLEIQVSELALLTVVSALLVGPVRRPTDLLPHLRKLSWRPLLLAVPFGLAVLASGLANIETHKILPHLLRQVELMVAFWWALNQLEENSRGLGWTTAALGWLPAILAGLAFVDLSSDSPALGNYGNPNQFGALAAFLIPVLVFQYVRVFSTRLQWLWAASLVLCAFCIWASFSRSALIAALVVVATLSILHFWKQRNLNPPFWRTLVGMALFLLLWVLGHYYMEETVVREVSQVSSSQENQSGPEVDPGQNEGPSSRRPRRIPKDPLSAYLAGRLSGSGIAQTLRHRLILQDFAAGLWRSSPVLGIGPGTYTAAFQEEREQLKLAMFGNVYSARHLKSDRVPPEVTGTLAGAAVHPHNLYWMILAELGLFGLLAFLFYAGSLTMSLWQRWRLDPTSLRPIAGLALLCGWLLHSLVDVTFYSLAMELGLLLALTSAPKD